MLECKNFRMLKVKQLFRFDYIIIKTFFFLQMTLDSICLPITLNNPFKAFCSNKKYTVTIQTRTRQIVNSIFFIDKKVLIELIMFIDIQNQLPIIFVTYLVCNKILKVRNSVPCTHKFLTFNNY